MTRDQTFYSTLMGKEWQNLSTVIFQAGNTIHILVTLKKGSWEVLAFLLSGESKKKQRERLQEDFWPSVPP